MRIFNKKFLFALVILIFSSLVLFAALFYWRYQVAKKQSEKEVLGPVGTLYLSRQQKLKEETSSWNTYINQVYGFSFKYPQEWQVSESKDEWKLWDQVIGVRQYPGVVLGQIHVYKQFVDGKRQDINESLEILSKNGKVSETTSNGKKIYRIDLIDSTSNSSTIYTLFEQENRVIQIGFVVPDVAKDTNMKLVNNLLDTLQLK
ncbi:MAG: hypothetical protein Q8L64_02555 [bacterium]|nr:hypothetical protein [bacterium]